MRRLTASASAVVLLLGGVPTFATAAEDLTPPEVLDYLPSTTSVDITAADATVTFDVRITDDLSGFRRAYVRIMSPSDAQYVVSSITSTNRISGDATDGTYRYTMTIPQYSETGTWYLEQFNPTDEVGNTDNVAGDLTAAGFPTTLEVTGVADSAAPEAVDFTPSTTSVDITAADATVTFDVQITDDLSGFRRAYVRIKSPSDAQYVVSSITSTNRISGDATDGTYRYTMTIPQYSETGTWYLEQFNPTDEVGNTDNVAGDLTAAGFPTTLEVTGVADVTAPTALAYDPSTTVVNVAEGAETVTFDVRITDDLSGFRRAYVRIMSPSDAQYVVSSITSTNRISGDATDGTYRYTMTIPQYSETGTWYLEQFNPTDEAGNTDNVTSDLVAAGLPTTIEVLDEPPVATFIMASLTNDSVAGEAFAHPAVVTVSATVDGTPYVADAETEPDATFWVEGLYGPEGDRLDLVPGIEVVATDGTTTRVLTLDDVTIDRLDHGTDVVGGTADVPDGTTIGVDVGAEFVGSFGLGTVIGGAWEITSFDGGFDVAEGMSGTVFLPDDDGDETRADFRPPMIEAFLARVSDPGGLGIVFLTPGGDADVAVYDGAVELYQEILTGEPGSDNVVVPFPGPMVPGLQVVATDLASGYTKTLDVAALTFDTFDTVANVAGGDALGLSGAVEFSDAYGELLHDVEMTIAPDGTWSVTGIDLTEDMIAGARVRDSAGAWDLTYANSAPHHVAVDLANDVINVASVEGPSATIEVFVDGVPIASFPEVLVAELEPGYFGIGMTFDVHGIDLVPEMTVQVTDDLTGRLVELVTAELTVDGVDHVTDLVEGTAEPGGAVTVRVEPAGGDLYEVTTTAGTDGTWSVDLSVVGFGPEDGPWALVRDSAAPTGADETTTRETVDATELTADLVSVGQPTTVVLSFTDAPGLEHEVTVDWGDGTTSPAEVDEGAGTATASHVYAEAGVYEATATVADTAGAGNADTVSGLAVVYDPDGGFVTGGGWIDSPAGAYTPDPSLEGKATFGFVAKYQRGAQTPSGNTQFVFHAADMRFHATSYDWLVVAGQERAIFKGSGEVNGVAGHTFMLTATDGEPDTLRMRIWEEDTGTVVYDNQTEGGGTALGGGSIIIHTR